MSQRRIKIHPQYHHNHGHHHNICITYAAFLQTAASGNDYLLLFVDIINQLDWNSLIEKDSIEVCALSYLTEYMISREGTSSVIKPNPTSQKD